jgi:integrase
MPSINMTALWVNGLTQEGDTQIDYFDKKTKRLGLRLGKSGTKTWFIMYRLPGDRKKKRLTLKRYPAMSLTEARKEAEKLLKEIDRGVDPAAERHAEDGFPTFKDISEIYLQYHAKRHKRPASIREDVRILRKELLPRWKNRKAKDIQRRDAIALLEDIADHAPVMANRVLALASTIFNVAIKRELLIYNPCYRLKKPGGKEKSSSRVLKPREIKALWRVLSALPQNMAANFKIRLLTAQRGSEICSMQWADIDFKQNVWTIPETVTMNKIAHRVPLSAAVLDILNALPRKSPWVFPSNYYRAKSGHIVNMQKTTKKLRQKSKVSDFKMLDLRRTASALMPAMGISEFTVAQLLNLSPAIHITADPGLDKYETEKRLALDKWANRVLQIVEGK